MWIKLAFVLPILLGFPDLFVRGTQKSIDVAVDGQDPLLEHCLQSGLEVRYRFELKVCKKRDLWFDRCKGQRLVIHRLEHDPISESYKVSTDIHKDDSGPNVATYKTLPEAKKALSVVRDLQLTFLTRNNLNYIRSDRAYLSIRMESSCHGEYNKTLAHISYFLTLGLVNIVGVDSGWVDFPFSKVGGE